MSNSGLIAALGSVAAAVFFLAAVVCEIALRFESAAGHGGGILRILFAVALILSAIYLFVSLFWGVRATSLESFQVTKKD